MSTLQNVIYFFSLNSAMLIHPATPNHLVSEEYVTLYFRMTLETWWKTKTDWKWMGQFSFMSTLMTYIHLAKT